MGKGSRTVKGKHNAAKTNKNEQKRPNIDQEIIPHSEVSRKGKEIDTGMEFNPTSNKETDGTTLSDNNDNASRHANPSDKVMNENDDVDSLDVLKLKAAVPFDNVIKEK